jgi:hypothetical protein
VRYWQKRIRWVDSRLARAAEEIEIERSSIPFNFFVLHWRLTRCEMKTLRDATVQREIRSRLENLTADDTARWGLMSVHQMVCHLRDAFLVPLGEKTTAMIEVPIPRAAMKWLALQAPMEWRHGFRTAPEVAQDVDGTPPVEFEGDRASLLVVLDQFCGQLPEPCVPHAFFGEMSPEDWLRWGYLHTDHHLRQFGR